MATKKIVIKIKDVTKTYHTGVFDYQALKGINFEIQEGEMVAIMGPSGSGKSTTLHILGVLDMLDTGIYELNGITIKKYSNDRLAEIRNQEIGFIFQSFNLLPRASIAKNVELPLIYRGIKKQERMVMVHEALKEVGLDDRADYMPNQISGGQVQRVAIARAIVGKPALILADEPTGNLDSKTAMEVMKIFQKMNRAGKTLVIITHEHDIAECCQRVITLKDGEILSDLPNKHIVNL